MSRRRLIKVLAITVVASGALAGPTFAQVQNSGGELSKKLDVETHTFYYGQYDRLDFRLWGRRLACERVSDPDKFKKMIQEICGADREAFWKAATPDIEGTMCGYHGFSVACIKVKGSEDEHQAAVPVSRSGSGANGTTDAMGTVKR
jgi:hypothetical protein